MTKKIFSQPELIVLHIGKEICTDIIVASAQSSFNEIENVGAPGVRDIFDPYNAGY